MSTPAVKAIAIYLPQFHPIPENDAWWGKGFTEWTNVAKARPLFKGHYQPHLPADLGFYDLRLPEVREAQARMAKEHGIHGFCYYHYWFNGKRLLNRPFDEVLASGKPDFPFCLCWANENWTRRWDGKEAEVLIKQDYNHEDDRRHSEWLVKAFQDPRYIRVEGRPLFLIYRASLLPDSRRTCDIIREECQCRAGVRPFICKVESFGSERGDPAECGFDAAVEFQPDWNRRGPQIRSLHRHKWLGDLLGTNKVLKDSRLFSYEELAKLARVKPDPSYLRFPCVTPGWDNSARRKSGAAVFIDSQPEEYRLWLSSAVERVQSRDAEHRLLFINAWNEWAEGNHLEPCQRWGRAFLEATREVLCDARLDA